VGSKEYRRGQENPLILSDSQRGQRESERGRCGYLQSYTQWKPSKKVKWSRYRSGVAQRVGRGIALLFHDRGTRRGWVVSSITRPHFTPGKDPVPIVQKAGWAPGPVWTGGKSRPHRDSIPDRRARSQSLYRLNCPAHGSLVDCSK